MQLGTNQLLRDPINDLRYFLGRRLRFVFGRHFVAVQDIHDLAPLLFRDDVEEVVWQMFVDAQVRPLVVRAMTAQTMLVEKRHERLAITRLIGFKLCRRITQPDLRRQKQGHYRAATKACYGSP